MIPSFALDLGRMGHVILTPFFLAAAAAHLHGSYSTEQHLDSTCNLGGNALIHSALWTCLNMQNLTACSVLLLVSVSHGKVTNHCVNRSRTLQCQQYTKVFQKFPFSMYPLIENCIKYKKCTALYFYIYCTLKHLVIGFQNVRSYMPPHTP